MPKVNMLRELLSDWDYKPTKQILGSDNDVFAELVQRIVNSQRFHESDMVQADNLPEGMQLTLNNLAHTYLELSIVECVLQETLEKLHKK